MKIDRDDTPFRKITLVLEHEVEAKMLETLLGPTSVLERAEKLRKRYPHISESQATAASERFSDLYRIL